MVSTNSPFWATVAAIAPQSDTAPVTRDYADTLPYASVLARLDGGSKAFMVLAEVGPDGSLSFMSANRQVVVVRGPFVVQTAGLTRDLTQVAFAAGVPGDLRLMDGQTLTREVDAQSVGRYGWRLAGTFRKKGLEEVVILDKPMTLLRIDEEVMPQGGDAYTNSFWVDPQTGFVWKSSQRPHPNAPVLHLEVTKPAART